MCMLVVGWKSLFIAYAGAVEPSEEELVKKKKKKKEKKLKKKETDDGFKSLHSLHVHLHSFLADQQTPQQGDVETLMDAAELVNGLSEYLGLVGDAAAEALVHTSSKGGK